MMKQKVLDLILLPAAAYCHALFEYIPWISDKIFFMSFTTEKHNFWRLKYNQN